MTQTGHRSYVFDASVLIDYSRTNKNLLKLITTHIAPIRAPFQILREVRQLNENECAELGIVLTDPSLQDLIEARQLSGALSLADCLCFILAHTDQIPCVTNDKALRMFCETNGVKPFWGLEPLLWLTAVKVLPKDGALATAKAFHRSNPRFITPAIVKMFAEKLQFI